MAKTVDIPKPLRDFNKQFNLLNYKYDTADVFSDMLDLMVTLFIWEGDKELGDRLKKKYKDDYQQLCVLVQEMLHAYKNGIGGNDDHPDDWNWYDGIGEYYEVITSSYKSSRLGQFFTPKPICDMMALITHSDLKIENFEDKTITKLSDPCCGSGRMVLAYNKVSPNNYHYATDIDTICTKMTAVNMAIHGIRGQVVCADALQYGQSWRFGYEINRDLYKNGFPSIHIITQDECFQSKVSTKSFGEIIEKTLQGPEEKIEKEINRKFEIKEHKVAEKGQLSLF